ncbi:protein Hook homolog 2 isoform X3 [Melopsittacus undulatus]|uniref:protein Hook homolog 2 isoform X3 n=1 Tax=Melopsittacus undulatus TaxID=13146 RepID=UPI00146C6CD6|nr:protein Hook homolog 2 isoform X3 [Melopsittacus undulatus]
MAAAGRDVCGALLTWLQTFAPPSPCASPQDLSNGVALAYVLHSIDSSWFNETWLGLIRDDAGDNWRLKVSNLRKVLQSLLEYWQDVLGRAVPEHQVPDVVLAAQGAEPQELGRMVLLVLACALCGQGREEHIQRILSLEEPVQRLLMLEIQELLDKEVMETDESQEQSRSCSFLSPALEGLGQRCRELELQEQSRLVQENRALREENDRLEREARRLQARAQQLRGPVGEGRALREERDALRSLEAAVASFRGSTWELRRRAHALEEREHAQLRRAAALELSRAQAARRQVEELRAERWQHQFCCLQERYQALSEEKERLQEERDALREANEELRCAQLQQSCLHQADGALVGSLAAELIPAELRNTVMRLQRENRRLQERLEATAVTPLHSTQGDSQAEFLLLDETIDYLDELQGDEDLDPHKDSSGSQCVKGLQQHQWGHSGGGQKVLDSPLAPELQTLRNQLQEKEALIRYLEGDWERSRAQREREERLLVTAWAWLCSSSRRRRGGGSSGAPPGGLIHSWLGAPPTAAPPPVNGGPNH